MPQITVLFTVNGPIRLVVRLALALVDLLDTELFNILVGNVFIYENHTVMLLPTLIEQS